MAAVQSLRPSLRPRSITDRVYDVAMVRALITRDAMTKVPKTCVAHELEILDAIFGEENIRPLPHDPTMLPTELVVDGETLTGEAAIRAALRRKVTAAGEYGRLAQCYGTMPETQTLWVAHVFGPDFRDPRFQAALELAERYEPQIQGIDYSEEGGIVSRLDYGEVISDPGRQPVLERLREANPEAFLHGARGEAPDPAAPPAVETMTKEAIVGELAARAVKFDARAGKGDLADLLIEARAQDDLPEEA